MYPGLSSGVAAISAGGDHTCALTTAGGVKCWGLQRLRPAGRRHDTNAHDAGGCVRPEQWRRRRLRRQRPHLRPDQRRRRQVLGLQRLRPAGRRHDHATATRRWTSRAWAAASPPSPQADYHTCALTTAGGVKCWGDNNYGQLGGTITPLPTQSITGGGSLTFTVTGFSSGSSCSATESSVPGGYAQAGNDCTSANLPLSAGVPRSCTISDSNSADIDDDGVLNATDNCPTVPNPSQADWDHDGFGDGCQDSDGDSLGLNRIDSGGACLTGGVPNPAFRDCIELFVGTGPREAVLSRRRQRRASRRDARRLQRRQTYQRDRIAP